MLYVQLLFNYFFLQSRRHTVSLLLIFYCSLIGVVCSRIGGFFSSARVNQNTVYCQAACVFDVKRGERSASVPMETVCVR